MKEQQEIEKNDSTEEKIKEAARRVFTRKGYAATRTRDIAEESGFNLALINYYFRSKEKLFDMVMLENIQTFIQSVSGIINDPETTLPQKIEGLVSHYIDMLLKNPDLPIFVLSEINADPTKMAERLQRMVKFNDTHMLRQWKEHAAAQQLTIRPLHIFLNMISLTIFPFVASPVFRNRTNMSQEDFNVMMMERKKLIPVWIMAMLNSNQ